MTIYFNSVQEMEKVLGINDVNVPYLEKLLDGKIASRGNQLLFSPDSEDFARFVARLCRLAELREESFGESELFMEWKAMEEEEREGVSRYDIIVAGRSLWPKSRKQKEYIAALNENQICFAVGPAGTGKTFIAIAYALSQVLGGKKQKLVLTRPVVEAGESLGFLPGDLSQKLNPYLKPLYDAMEFFIPPFQIRKMEETGQLEISPLAYMRGRSLNRSIVILDEAQNTTKGQMKMFLTRLGEDSKAIVTGDLTQIDLPKKCESGLSHALSILHDINSLSVIEFKRNDIIRSRLVREIIACYQEEEDAWNE